MQEREGLREKLEALADPEYRAFTARLLPTVGENRILGVRLPALRKLAKELAHGDWRAYLAGASDDFMEEIMLQGMTIGGVRAGRRGNFAVRCGICSEKLTTGPYATAFAPL